MDPVSTVEANFITKAAKDGLRVDGRGLNELRSIMLSLNRTVTQSSCIASYGETKWGCKRGR